MIIYTDQNHKKTRKQKVKEELEWIAQCHRDGLMANGKKFEPIKPLPVTLIRSGAEDFKKCPSLKSNESDCFKPKDKVYTGTKVLGIAVQHKSCLQPIFSQVEAVESAKMRRG